MLVAIEAVGKDKHGAMMWMCQCDCGNTSVVRARNLLSETTKSCGCWRKITKAGKKNKNKRSKQ